MQFTLWKNEDPSTSPRMMYCEGDEIVIEYPGASPAVKSDFDSKEEALEFMIRRAVKMLDDGYKMNDIK